MADSSSSTGASTASDPEAVGVNPDALSASDTAAKLASMESQVNAQAPASSSTTPPVTPATPPTPTNPTVPATPPSSTSSLNPSSPLYIGPTNLATLQKNYTPLQLENATTTQTNAAGNLDYYWKQGANINAPVTPPPIQAPTTLPPASTDDLNTPGGTTVDPSTLTSDQTSMATNTAVLNAAKQYTLPAVYAAIDTMTAQAEAADQAKIDAAQANENSVTNQLQTLAGNKATEENAVQTSTTQSMNQSLADLNTLATQMTNAVNDMSTALDANTASTVGGNVGTLGFMNATRAAITDNATAKINGLKTAMAAIQGDVDSAKTAADTQISIIQDKYATQTDALNTLLDLDKTNLVTLTDDEKTQVASRLANLKDVATAQQAQVTAVADLITKYPSAAVNGGVSFNDTEASALQKMLPKMSADEQLTFNLTNAKTAEDTALSAKNVALAGKDSGTGSGGTGSSAPAELADYTAQLAWAAGNNVTAQQAIASIEQKSGKALSSKAIAYIKSMLAGNKAGAVNPADKPLTAAGVKSMGYDPVAHPNYIGMTPAQITAAQATTPATPSSSGIVQGIKNTYTKIKNFFTGS